MLIVKTYEFLFTYNSERKSFNKVLNYLISSLSLGLSFVLHLDLQCFGDEIKFLNKRWLVAFLKITNT